MTYEEKKRIVWKERAEEFFVVHEAFREDIPDQHVAFIRHDPKEDVRPPFDIWTRKISKRTVWGKGPHGKPKDVVETERPQPCSSCETLKEAKEEAEDQIAQMYLWERPGYTYSHFGDFYGYRPFYFDKDGKPTCYYIEGRDGEMLIGDGLPSTEQEAKIYCRCANIAFEHGMEKKTEHFLESL